MKGKKQNSEQIIAKLRQAERDLTDRSTVGQVRQKLGISERTFTRWQNTLVFANPRFYGDWRLRTVILWWFQDYCRYVAQYAPMKLKATHHVAIFTQNFAAMEQFYTGTLGLRVTKRWDTRTIVFIDIGSTTIELIGRETAPPAGSTPGPIHHIALRVDDVDAAHAELVALGVKIKSAPANFEDVRICFFFDPDGNSLELVEDPRADR